jgi:hypothetical protein
LDTDDDGVEEPPFEGVELVTLEGRRLGDPDPVRAG